MRIFLFLIHFLFLLLCGGQGSSGIKAHKFAHSISSQNYKEYNQKNLSNNGKFNIIIEDADIDFEDDNLTSVSVKCKNANKFLSSKFYCSDFYFATRYFLNHYCKRDKNFLPFFGYSSPIYIIQRAIRI